MFKQAIIFLFLGTFFYSYGQVSLQSDGRQITNGSNVGFFRGNHLPDSFLKSGNKTINYKDINGTPYTDNKQKMIHGIASGKLYDSEFKLLNTLFIRYNAFTDNIELSKIDDGIDYFLLKKKVDAWYINLGENMYRAYNYSLENEQKIGFFVIISKDDSKYCTLLKKEKVIFKDAVAQQNAFITASPASFRRASDTYFIKIGNSVNLIPKKKKDFLQLFLLKKELLKKHLDANKYKLTKEKDLITIINYYNSIVI